MFVCLCVCVCVCVCVRSHACIGCLRGTRTVFLGCLCRSYQPSKKKVKRGPTDRAVGHRGDKCLFFLMRKDKPDEQKKQFNSQSTVF